MVRRKDHLPYQKPRTCPVNFTHVLLLVLISCIADKQIGFDVMETINQIEEECLTKLFEDDLIDERLRQEIPSRLLSLQKQLERLEREKFASRSETNDTLLASINSKANQTEVSLGTLKQRLIEMQQKLAAKQASVEANLGPKKKLPGKVKPGEFPTIEGEAFDDASDEDEIDDYFGSAFDTDEYLEDLDVGVIRGGGTKGLLDMSQVLSAVQKDIVSDNFEIVTKAESDLDNALSIFASPQLSLEEKLQMVQGKFKEVIQQDLYWRTEANKATRKLHDIRLQKRLADIERDRLMAINGRLEGFCRDLQTENRRMKAEAIRADEAVKNAIELAVKDKEVKPEPSSTATNTGKKGRKNKGKGPIETPQQPSSSFSLPLIPDRAVLETEEKDSLLNRFYGLVDLYQTREQHFASILETGEVEAKLCEAKIAQQQILLEKTISKLDLGESRVNELARNEADLKAQVRQYVDKFRQVEETLVKSNELFGTFRGEMEQMSVKLARFEKENTQMHSKCATLSKNIIEMADERTKLTAQIETLKSQKAKLEQLCRTLQAERNAARGKSDTVPSEGEEKPTVEPTPSEPQEQSS